MVKTILLLIVVAGILAAPADLSSCGPFLERTLFSNEHAPLDEAHFYAGGLDVVLPSYERIYLMAAYRYFSGIGLSAEDQKALVAPSAEPDIWNARGSQAVQEWLKSRATIGAPPIERIERFTLYNGNQYIVTCGDDAFRNAAATLNSRLRDGRSHDDLRAWVSAQDRVFANCSSPPQIPADPPPDAPAWMKADRAYQIAAAKFYAGSFDDAAAAFRRIGADRSSPWHPIAPYLAARALIRKTTLVDPTASAAALEQLRLTLADPDAKPWHASARGLERFLRVHTDPAGVLDELGRALETQPTGIAAQMNDYRLLLNHYDGRQDFPRHTDIADWIAAMQHDSGGHALAQWRATHSLPWLVAALTWATDPDPDLMAAARLPESSPAFLTASFHRARLLPPNQARPLVNAVLRRRLTVSARNLFLAERLRIARHWDDFLRDAPRTVVGSSVEGMAAETAKGRPVRFFDQDAAATLDRQVPLDLLLQAARSPFLPANLRRVVAETAWVRTVLLARPQTVKDVGPLLASLTPALKPYLDACAAAPAGQDLDFAEAWLLLNNPGMQPWIRSGHGRETPLHRIDNLRDNWWHPRPASEPLYPPLSFLYGRTPVAEAFLPAAARSLARRENAAMDAFPAATTFMARQAVEWASTHPADPRAPEALRLAVRAAHYSFQGDRQTDRWVRRAFELLHSRYPDSPAARQTPYWYRSPAL